MAFPPLFCSFSLFCSSPPPTPLMFISDDLGFFQMGGPILIPNKDIFSETSRHTAEIPCGRDCSQLPCCMSHCCSTMTDSTIYLLIEKGPNSDHTQKFVTLLTTAWLLLNYKWEYIRSWSHLQRPLPTQTILWFYDLLMRGTHIQMYKFH